MDPVISVQNKNFTGTQRSLQKFLEPDRNPKVILHWQFLGIRQSLWRSFLDSLHVDTTQIRNKWDCWKSSAQSERRHLCSIVAIRSEWKLVGRFHGMLFLSAKHLRSLVWMEDSIRKTFWETSSRINYSISFTDLVSPFYCEGPVKNPSIWKESITWIVPRIRSVRGENLEGWRTSRRPWGVGNDGRIGIYSKRLNAKEVIFPKKEKLLFFVQSQMDESISLEEIRNGEHPLWYGNTQFV